MILGPTPKPYLGWFPIIPEAVEGGVDRNTRKQTLLLGSLEASSLAVHFVSKLTRILTIENFLSKGISPILFVPHQGAKAVLVHVEHASRNAFGS